MKLGILSLKYRSNYGGILQSFALQTYLESLGHEVEIIDYTRSTKESNVWVLINRAVNFAFSGEIFSVLSDRKKEINKRVGVDSDDLILNNDAFMKKYLKLSRSLNDEQLADYCEKYDCIIVGSDQVWSVSMSRFLAYFFDWEYRGKKVAYSACTVNSKPSILNFCKIKRLLNNFDSISVRDNVSYNFVKRITGNNVPITADPTFLVDIDFKKEILSIINEPYMLTYILGDEIEGGNASAISIIKQKLGIELRVVSIVIPSNSLAGENGADIVIDNCSPDMWVSLIKNASFVFTDSFHGCVFSIKYEKPFIGYYNMKKRATRLLDLKQRYGLDNIISKPEEIEDAVKNSMKKDDVAILDHVNKSKEYLMNL